MTRCWIVTEGMAGTENQCLGVAEALGVLPEIKRIGLRQPWKSLSPWLGLESPATFCGDALAPPWPDLLLASGRKAVAAARYIKKASGGKSFTVMIQDPRTAPDAFDLVAVPAHDKLRGGNVIVTDAAPNRITPDKLTEAKNEFSPLLSPLPAPRVAVMIGGNSMAYRMTETVTQRLAAELCSLARRGYGLMVTASRRTGEANRALLESELTPDNIYFWDGNGDNPYFGFLAWADYIMVTADSVSMISEAASTGKPVYIIPLEGGKPRIKAFHDGLIDKGVTKVFGGGLEPYSYTALNDAQKVAAEIRERMGLEAVSG